MYNKKSLLGRTLSLVLALALVFSLGIPAFAAEVGTYEVDATLSCYVNAMGGVEFSDGYGLMTGATATVAEDGSATVTINLGTTSGLSIYGVACTAFIGTDEAPGIYVDGVVSTEGVTYTVSENTVANANGEVNYIDSITFPVSTETSTYTLWLYLDSNVMGCQLGDGTGTGSSNQPGVATAHTATLTIAWPESGSSEETTDAATETSTGSANVEYTVEGGYEVSIPATITVGADKTGAYTVELTKLVAPANSYVTVTADTAGTLTCGEASVAFTNALASGNLTAVGQTLAGTVTVTEDATVSGTYAGVLNFVISYFEGAAE